MYYIISGTVLVYANFFLYNCGWFSAILKNVLFFSLKHRLNLACVDRACIVVYTAQKLKKKVLYDYKLLRELAFDRLQVTLGLYKPEVQDYSTSALIYRFG
ncbi:hypothetical protein BY458DRAFT_495016 [Sporodiniella umbellata]|nr:hypothetical protein BY458DRAFT_495016 [Sporodiniella umbellata]